MSLSSSAEITLPDRDPVPSAVLHAGGALGGYGGLERKRRLLELEGPLSDI